jgi:signal transduction histidine kinase
MLDIPTLLVIQAALALIHGLAWLAVWWAQPRVPGLGLWNASILLGGIGLGLLLLRGTWPDLVTSTGANLCFVGSYGLMQFAHADLLQRPRYTALVLGSLGVVLVLWPVLLLVWPDYVGLRTAANTTLFAVLSVSLAWTFVGARRLMWLLRRTFAACWLLHAAFCLLRGITGIDAPPGEEFLTFSISHAVWASENILATITCSVMFGILIGAYLNRQLLRQNAALAAEIAESRRLQTQLTAALVHEAALRQEQQIFVTRVCGAFQEPLLRIGQRAMALLDAAGSVSPSIAKRLDSIVGATRRLAGLIENFLLDRRQTDGLAEMPLEPVALQPLLAELTQQRQPLGVDRIQLILRSQPLWVRGNAPLLAVVFGNLVDNALKYSAPDAPVEVTLECADEEAVVTVTDHGIGIPARDLGAIGQRFFRATNAANVPGTGLGLFSAGRLIQFHGGHFMVDSVPDRGTRITVHLPLHGAA